MKIAFTGAGGTGKTTLAKYIAEKWGVPYVGSVSREVMREMGVESEMAQETMTPEQLLVLQQGIYERRKAKLASLDSYVTDRCALDNYIYGLRRCGPSLTEVVRAEWETKAVKDLYDQDLVFYTPIGLFPVEHDGVRVTDISHQFLMDAAMYGFICKHAFDRCSAHVYVMNMSDLERRKKFVDSLISEVYSNVR
jgi:nicotinamide riboside kinase